MTGDGAVTSAKRRLLRARTALVSAWRARRLAVPPGHYYSPLPSSEELACDAARIWPPAPRRLPGIDLREGAQLALLDELAGLDDPSAIPAGPRPGHRYHARNDFYGPADAIVLLTMLRHLRPRRVVEVGSGFSSALMLDVDERHLGGGTAFTFVDPHPCRLRALVGSALARVDVVAERIQDVDVTARLEGGDLLFVDSSHTAKVGSDVNHIVLDLLPRLPAGVVVHFHDVFYPFEYPRSFLAKGYYWNEAYLLRAQLSGNAAFEILLWPSFLERFHRDALAERLPLALSPSPGFPELHGASLWLRKAGG